MHHVPPSLRPAGGLLAKSPALLVPGLLLLVVGLALTMPAPAPAQNPNVQALPIAFRNQTDSTLIIEAESIVDDNNFTTNITGSWTLKPGEYSYLADTNNFKIYAKKFNYRCKAAGRESRWVATSNGPDASGYFTVNFTPDNYRSHLATGTVTGGGGGGGVFGQNPIRSVDVTWRDATGQFAQVLRQLPDDKQRQIAALAAPLLAQGRDLYAATVTIRNTGNQAIFITPNNIRILLNGASYTVTSAVHPSFFPTGTLQPGQSYSGLVFFDATLNDGATLTRGGGSIQYNDFNIRVTYNGK